MGRMKDKFLEIKVNPNSKTRSLRKHEDGTWSASVMALPIDGKANEELIRLVAKHFDTRKKNIIIKRGSKAGIKLIQIAKD